MDSRGQDQPDTGLELAELADRLHSAAIHLLRRLRQEDDASGLTAPRLSALSVVVFGGPISISNLAAAEQVQVPTISRLVKELERDGLVSRRRDPEDARVQRIEATGTGRSLLQEGRRRRIDRLVTEIRALPARDRRRLEAAVGALESLVLPEGAAARRPRLGLRVRSRVAGSSSSFPTGSAE